MSSSESCSNELNVFNDVAERGIKTFCCKFPIQSQSNLFEDTKCKVVQNKI